MNILPFKLVVLFCLIASLVSGDEESSRPNVLLLISDDQAWNDYSFMGHEEIETPHLDRLAKQSLTFKRGYTPVPLCRPSLSTMITGLYPHDHGVVGNDPALPDQGVNPQTARMIPKYRPIYESVIANFEKEPNLVRDLVESGYLALQTGKWWEGDPKKVGGFTHAMTVGTGKGDRHGGAGLVIGREGLAPIKSFLKEADAAEKPWLVWYAPFLPHTPHTPPEDLLQKYLKLAPTEAVARYWACVEWFDLTCGELLQHIDERGERENTIVLYACDNGWIQLPDKINRYAPRSKRTPYEGGVRSPIMVSWPGSIEPKMDEENLASTIDLWPTLAALLNRKAPSGLPGIDLTNVDHVQKRRAIFGESFDHDIAEVKNPARSLQFRWMIEGNWKVIVPDPVNSPNNSVELYEVVSDPWEKKNLASKHPEKAKKMVGKLDEWWTPVP